MGVTLKDIGEKVGLSAMTVSCALRGKGAVAEGTRKRVLHAARELGYRPNAFARGIRRGRFGQIALLLSTHRGRSNLPQALLDGIHDALAERELQLAVVKLPDEKLTDAGFVPKILREWMCDGLLINYTDHIPSAMVELIETSRHPSVWLNAKREHDCVYPDDFDAGRRLTELLIGYGHRRIAYVDLHFAFEKDSEPRHYSKWDRWGGYEAAMRDAGFTPGRVDKGALTFPRPGSIRGFWADPAGSWLAGEDRPTAVVCYGGPDAAAVALAAQKLGLRLPGDLAMAGFADRDQALVSGMLPPVALLPHERLGRGAVEMVLSKLAGPAGPRQPLRVPFDVDARDAAGPEAQEYRIVSDGQDGPAVGKRMEPEE